MTVCAPYWAAVRVSEQAEKAPEALAVHVPVIDPVVIAKLTVPDVKPVPEAMRLPTGPALGERVRLAETVKGAVAEEAPLLPVRVWAPYWAALKVIEHAEKAPLELAVHVPAIVPVVTVKLTVPAVNPLPDAEIVVPTGPDAGLRERLEATVNVAEPDEGPPVPVTVWAPYCAAVRVREHPEKAPVESAVQVPVKVPVEIVKLTVPGEKPEPEAVITLPTGPDVGESTRVEATVKVAVALDAPLVPVTVWAP